MESLTLQPIARVDGTINLPGSKSVSNRALLLAAWYWHFVDVVWLGLYVLVYWM